MYDEGLVVWIPCGGGFEAANIGTVAQLSLSVASNDFISLSWLQKELVLLWSSLVSESYLHSLLEVNSCYRYIKRGELKSYQEH